MASALVTATLTEASRILVAEAAELPDRLADATDAELLAAVTAAAELIDYLRASLDLMYDVRRAMFRQGRERGLGPKQMGDAAGVTGEAVILSCRKP